MTEGSRKNRSSRQAERTLKVFYKRRTEERRAVSLQEKSVGREYSALGRQNLKECMHEVEPGTAVSNVDELEDGKSTTNQ